MTIISDHLRTLAADQLRVAEAIQKIEAERDYYRALSERLAKLVPREEITYADRTEIELLETRPIG